MSILQVDLERISTFVTREKLGRLREESASQLQRLMDGSGPGSDFLGWIRLPSSISRDLMDRIGEEAARQQQFSEVVVVVGIGGSYLGARAVIEALGNPFSHLVPRKGQPTVIYAGHQLDEDYHAALLELLDQKEYSLVVISKSGTTTEPAMAFRLLKDHLERKYGKSGAGKRIVAITDGRRGALKSLADREGYPTFTVPDDVGGRYSVLTPVGLLPIAIAGIDIRALLEGAREMQQASSLADTTGANPVVEYAAARNALYRSGKLVEILVSYHPGMSFFAEWWKQLYGESEGKQGKGIFPASVTFTTDLHSMGQYIQDGARQLFETVISIGHPRRSLLLPSMPDDADGLNFLAGKNFHYVNRMAELGTLLAHVEGGVPNIILNIDRLDEKSLGQLVYFFELACGISGYVLGVNPFDQPGVEAYKKNMFALLGKPGFEKEGVRLRSLLGNDLPPAKPR